MGGGGGMCPSMVNGLAVMGKSWPRPKLACGVGAMVLIHVYRLYRYRQGCRIYSEVRILLDNVKISFQNCDRLRQFSVVPGGGLLLVLGGLGDKKGVLVDSIQWGGEGGYPSR